MKKVIKLTESKLREIISRIINEQESGYYEEQALNKPPSPTGFKNKTVDDYLPQKSPSGTPFDGLYDKFNNTSATSKQEAIMRLQYALGLVVDGKFGNKTKARVSQLQKNLGLAPTGVYDRRTMIKANNNKEVKDVMQGVDKFLPLYAQNTFTPPPPLSTKPSIDPGQQNPGANEDPSSYNYSAPLATKSSTLNVRKPQLASRPQYRYPEDTL